MASCSYCRKDRWGRHQPGCPAAEGAPPRGPRRRDPSGPGGDRGNCPKGGDHNKAWRAWTDEGPFVCQRIQYCKKCNQDLSTDKRSHNYDWAGVCKQCGRIMQRRKK